MILKTGEAPSTHPGLGDQILLRLNKVNKIKDYFIREIRGREAMSKRLSKYISVFDYISKTFIVLTMKKLLKAT